MAEFDFKPYSKIEDMVGYDGFIGPNGEFYRVKKRNQTSLETTHITWSDAYIKFNKNMFNTIMSPSYSMLLMISKLKTKQNILIHAFGYLYYSHEHLLRTPIIISPNPIYNAKSVTKEQLDTLFQIMEKNNEHPLQHEIFTEPEEYCKSNNYI